MAARTDKTTDPALRAALLTARRGQAYFSRFVSQLSDREFDAPSLVPGWSRRHVVAHVGLNARAITRLTTWAATGAETPMYASAAERDDEIEFTATLPVAALCNLNAHAAIHLNVEWRDLDPEHWRRQVRTIQGRKVPATETIWMRTREVWIHAVDLDNGGRFEDFPSELLVALLTDVSTLWERRRAKDEAPAVRLVPTDRPDTEPMGPATAAIVATGTAAALARWATGRGTSDVAGPNGARLTAAPRWL